MRFHAEVGSAEAQAILPKYYEWLLDDDLRRPL